MIVTEVEASKRWCHRRDRVVFKGKFVGNPNEVCIGSQCMAWAWFDPERDSDGERRGKCGLTTVGVGD